MTDRLIAYRMTPWEKRGYLAYPNLQGRPRSGTQEEINWCRGWEKAQREDLAQATDNEWEWGRDSYFAHYDEPVESEQMELRF